MTESQSNEDLLPKTWVDAFWEKAIEEHGIMNMAKQDYGKTKYDRVVKGAKADGTIDVYAVLKTFNVTCPARQHALKKLLCTGIRGKGDAVQDLKESIVAIERAIELEKQCPTSSGT